MLILLKRYIFPYGFFIEISIGYLSNRHKTTNPVTPLGESVNM